VICRILTHAATITGAQLTFVRVDYSSRRAEETSMAAERNVQPLRRSASAACIAVVVQISWYVHALHVQSK
jgi:hypothetical protein